jgi:prepilin-type N-terminal cleavage/methylation domain-containing protein
MFLKKKNGYKIVAKSGFTVIEMLVVVAIIAVITAVVLVSLNQARSQSRDKKRVSDIKSLQLSLEFYYTKNKAYPFTLNDLGIALPKDPQTNEDYKYVAIRKGSSSRCTSYHVGAVLENADSEYLKEDSDIDSSATTISVNGESLSICRGTVAVNGINGVDPVYDVWSTY